MELNPIKTASVSSVESEKTADVDNPSLVPALATCKVEAGPVVPMPTLPVSPFTTNLLVSTVKSSPAAEARLIFNTPPVSTVIALEP